MNKILKVRWLIKKFIESLMVRESIFVQFLCYETVQFKSFFDQIVFYHENDALDTHINDVFMIYKS